MLLIKKRQTRYGGGLLSQEKQGYFDLKQRWDIYM